MIDSLDRSSIGDTIMSNNIANSPFRFNKIDDKPQRFIETSNAIDNQYILVWFS